MILLVSDTKVMISQLCLSNEDIMLQYIMQSTLTKGAFTISCVTL